MKHTKSIWLAMAFGFSLFTACADTDPKAEQEKPGQEEPEPNPARHFLTHTEPDVIRPEEQKGKSM